MNRISVRCRRHRARIHRDRRAAARRSARSTSASRSASNSTSLPGSVPGQLAVTPCPDCAPVLLNLDQDTRFYVGEHAVSMALLRQYAQRAGREIRVCHDKERPCDPCHRDRRARRRRPQSVIPAHRTMAQATAQDQGDRMTTNTARTLLDGRPRSSHADARHDRPRGRHRTAGGPDRHAPDQPAEHPVRSGHVGQHGSQTVTGVYDPAVTYAGACTDDRIYWREGTG